MDSAPLPLITTKSNMASSIMKYSIPSPFLVPVQFIAHPSEEWLSKAPAKIRKLNNAPILPNKPMINIILPNDCAMMTIQAMYIGIFFNAKEANDPLIPTPPPKSSHHPKSFCMPYGNIMIPETTLIRVKVKL